MICTSVLRLTLGLGLVGSVTLSASPQVPVGEAGVPEPPRAESNGAESTGGEAFVRYVERPGSMEFTGVLCARPVQPSDQRRLGLTTSERRARAASAREALAGFELVDYVGETDETLFRVPEGETENSVANALLATGDFAYVEPDWLVYPVECPNDSQFSQQWAHQANRMQSCDAWDIETGDPNVVVAICDSGILATHEDLMAHRREGYNAATRIWELSGGDISDINGHGTNCSGTAVANGDNGVGVTGVGFNLGHRTMRVTNNTDGTASLAALTHAARVAMDAGDRVASVSFSGASASSVNSTGTYCRERGGMLVWAAGNDSVALNGTRNDDVLIIGATTSSDVLAGYSNFGGKVDFTAPGSSIRTTSRNGNSSYSNATGTSFACPMVAGLCGLIFSRNPYLSPEEVEVILRQSCEDLGPAGVEQTYGWGRINAYEAMLLTPPPAVAVSFPGGQPEVVAPGGGDTIDLLVSAGLDSAVGGTLWINIGPGFVSQPMSDMGGGLFSGVFPAAQCDSEVEYYFEVALAGGGIITEPVGGANAPLLTTAYEATVQFMDAMETDMGWSVGAPGDDATTGIWARIDPNGTAAQPENDASESGSLCFATGQANAGASVGTNDVDGGTTTLISPALDLQLATDPHVGYWRWYSNDEGSSVDDVFVVDVSNDGGATWVNVETLSPGDSEASGGWFYHTFRLSEFVSASADVRFRFLAADTGSGSIVEAAIDDFQIFEPCPGDCGWANYCIAEPSSVGIPARIGATGTSSFAANDLVLFAADCPANSIGLFAYSPDQNSAPAGNGTLCLGATTLGTVLRLQIVNVDVLGNAVLAFDNQAPPLPVGQVAAGETWNFQFLFRDVAAGGQLYNLTNALAVTFCP